MTTLVQFPGTRLGKSSEEQPEKLAVKRPMTPLAILLATMRQKWTDGDTAGATALAKVTAPYIHARRIATKKSTQPSTEASQLTDDELAIRLAAASGRTDYPHGDPQQPDGLD